MLTISYLTTLLLTLILEIVVVLVAWLFGYRKKYILLSVILVNLITNPLLNYILWLNNSSYNFFTVTLPNLILLEILVVFVEWLLLVFAIRRNFVFLFILSLIANAISFITGLFLLPL